MCRQNHLDKLYTGLIALKEKIGGFQFLKNPNLPKKCPSAGVYFFFDSSELRDDGKTPRIVRVGTHAISGTSSSSLWSRLAQHRGSITSGGGNHRGSIFRKLVGISKIKMENLESVTTWGVKPSIGIVARDFELTPSEVSRRELPLELKVSDYIRNLPFLCLEINDPEEGRKQRAIIEKSTIALLSNFQKPSIDSASKTWLGNYCDYGKNRKVIHSGLWNNDFVDQEYDPAFLGLFKILIDKVKI
tara:strand:+ start:411 stop:1145 length:735 start_codon:yes stop_codon:yes gene_type:complete